VCGAILDVFLRLFACVGGMSPKGEKWVGGFPLMQLFGTRTMFELCKKCRAGLLDSHWW